MLNCIIIDGTYGIERLGIWWTINLSINKEWNIKPARNLLKLDRSSELGLNSEPLIKQMLTLCGKRAKMYVSSDGKRFSECDVEYDLSVRSNRRLPTLTGGRRHKATKVDHRRRLQVTWLEEVVCSGWRQRWFSNVLPAVNGDGGGLWIMVAVARGGDR
jgi:hypothetical protein